MPFPHLKKALFRLHASIRHSRSEGALLVIALILLSAGLRAQTTSADSLQASLKRKISAMLDKAEQKFELDHTEGYRLAMEARRLAEAAGDHRSLSRAYLIMVRENVQYLDNQFAAVGPGLQAIREAELAGDTLQLARAYINMGLYNNAVSSTTLEQNLMEGIRVAREMNEPELLARGLYNLARERFRQTREREGVELCRESIGIASKHDLPRLVVANMVAIAVRYEDPPDVDMDSSLFYFRESIKLAESTGELRYRAYSLTRIAEILEKSGMHADAMAAAQQALDLATANGLSKERRDAYHTLFWIHQQRGEFAKALQYYMQYDTCENKATSDRIAANAGRLQADYAYERERELATAKSIERELLLQAERRRQLFWLVLAITMAVAITVITVVVYRSLQRTRKAKRVIEEQKRLVEDKQREILDSINYSKRLQDAILPPKELIEQYFPENFVLYMPKDIVAGDFYWLKQEDDTLFLATADCTGHGVPGALVSVVCAGALRQAVRDLKLTDPGKVLDAATSLLLDTFGASGAHVHDGMDISLLAIDLRDRTVRWCGANIPLFYIPGGTNGHDRGPLTKVQPDRQPVGRHDGRKPFTTITLDIEPGTTLYLFSDGFADQFGGGRDKKFMRRSFQQLLEDTAEYGLSRQGEILRRKLAEWRKDADQTDDITVVGIRF
jgi:serine phosphatase RsbU (regulator of sigma subunit)